MTTLICLSEPDLGSTTEVLPARMRSHLHDAEEICTSTHSQMTEEIWVLPSDEKENAGHICDEVMELGAQKSGLNLLRLRAILNRLTKFKTANPRGRLREKVKRLTPMFTTVCVYVRGDAEDE